MNRKLLWPVFWLILVVAILNKIGGIFYLYWLTWWFDVVMHFLGGAWLASVTFWLLPLIPAYQDSQIGKREVGVAVIFVTLIVGLLWEAFELWFGISLLSAPDFWLDSVTDLILDLIGAMMVFWYVYLKSKTQN